MNLFEEFSTVIKAFQKKKVRFAIVGGLAMAFYDEPRFTRDIDILLHSEDEEKMAGALLGLGYFESAKAWKFRNTPIVLRRFVRTQGEEFIPVDILVGKTKRIDSMVDNAVDQPWSKGKVRVATKEDIITLKKGRGSDQDKVDIRKLKK
ncbi:MAG: nucleotidyl transferase AbiEii/AbiGii toxin family protein [Candidatus Methylomirabilia bacterium]